jgi:hypothetical protein
MRIKPMGIAPASSKHPAGKKVVNIGTSIVPLVPLDCTNSVRLGSPGLVSPNLAPTNRLDRSWTRKEIR